MNMDPRAVSAPVATHNAAMGSLRVFVTLLVIAHHAVLAYHPHAPAPPATLGAQPIAWPAFPVVDAQRWAGIDGFVFFNDVFFMSLMFLLSGLFVWPSLQRKGPGPFARDRLRRLGLPFVLSAVVLAPLAYFPSYLQTGADPRLSAFLRTWVSLPYWPAGPAWFLWVLLVLGCIAAGLTRLVPGWGDALGRAVGRLRRPAAFFWTLVAVSAVAYIPMSMAFGLSWFTAGPFVLQSSRPFHYAVYFFAGAAVGAHGLDRGLLAPDGMLRRRWPLWGVASLGAFIALVVLVVTLFSGLSRGEPPGQALIVGTNFAFVVSCAASCFAFLALFLRFARPGGVLDRMTGAAYGMYLFHYLFVTWLQYALLGTQLPGAAKGSLVFLGAATLSWAVTVALRRIPAVARVL
jgi:hypothetical protein